MRRTNDLWRPAAPQRMAALGALLVAAAVVMAAPAGARTLGLAAQTGLGRADAAPITARSGMTPSASTPCHTGITPVPIEHLIVIMEENESAGSVIGSRNAPYLNSLANTCGLATNYHNTDHPSTPNYLELTSGTAQGKAYYADCAYHGCPQSQGNIFAELSAADEIWKGYAESMPSNCDTGNTTLYAPRHNPPQFYSDLHNSGATSCGRLDVPLVSSSDTTGGPVVTVGNFTHDLNNNSLPNLAWIAPNLCDDGHSVSLGPSYCTTNRLKNFDAWLAAWVPYILNSPEYASGNTELMILFDEGNGADKVLPETCWIRPTRTLRCIQAAGPAPSSSGPTPRSWRHRRGSTITTR